MAALLRLTIPTCPPIPLLGGQEIVGGCAALSLEAVRDRMIPRRDHTLMHPTAGSSTIVTFSVVVVGDWDSGGRELRR